MENSKVNKASTTHGNGMHKSHEARGSHVRSGRQRSFPLNPKWLKNFLSEMLAVEMGGIKLYQKALNELEHSELKDKLNEFLCQTERHVELCTDMLRAADGDSNYRSPSAQVAEHKANGLIGTQVPEEMADLNNIENLVLAETKDHWNWEMLASVARKIGDVELKRMATKAIREVRRQEKTHLDWNEQTMSKLVMESAMHSPNQEMGESETNAGAGEKEENGFRLE
jgi:rubrerythrin